MKSRLFSLVGVFIVITMSLVGCSPSRGVLDEVKEPDMSTLELQDEEAIDSNSEVETDGSISVSDTDFTEYSAGNSSEESKIGRASCRERV